MISAVSKGVWFPFHVFLLSNSIGELNTQICSLSRSYPGVSKLEKAESRGRRSSSRLCDLTNHTPVISQLEKDHILER